MRRKIRASWTRTVRLRQVTSLKIYFRELENFLQKEKEKETATASISFLPPFCPCFDWTNLFGLVYSL